MNYFYFNFENIVNQQFEITGEEFIHISKSFRYRFGDHFFLLNGKGTILKVEILQIDKKSILIKIIDSHFQNKENVSIHICLAVLKQKERMEWFVEKAVEAMAYKISFYFADNSEKKGFNLDRVHKIAIAALKQSGNAWLPEIAIHKDLKDLITSTSEDQKFICHTPERENSFLTQLVDDQKSIAILIGPEGDFTAKELDYAIQNGFEKAGLGKSRYRAETAAIASLFMIKGIHKN